MIQNKIAAKLGVALLLSAFFNSCNISPKNENQPENGRKIIKEYYDNGKIKSINEVIGDKRDGICKYYDMKGNLTSTIEFKMNMYHGKYISYYTNKNKKAEITYVNHKRNGPAYSYFENGKIYLEENYENDELNGMKKKYYGNGKLLMENEYKNGQPSIYLKEYDPNGNLKNDYPSIVIEPVDHILLEQRYILKVYFSNKARKSTFYIGDLEDNKFLPQFLPEYKSKNGIAEIEFDVPKGTVIMKTINIIGKKTTNDGNTYITTKKYNLAVKN